MAVKSSKTDLRIVEVDRQEVCHAMGGEREELGDIRTLSNVMEKMQFFAETAQIPAQFSQTRERVTTSWLES